MTDREREMCAAYIPSPRDETLAEDEYYIMDAADRVQRVWVREIAPDMRTDRLLYLPRNRRGVVHGWTSDEDGWVSMGYLYDNKQDCRDGTHNWFDRWETLRALQKEESSA